MEQSYQRIFGRRTRRFGRFPSKTYHTNRILGDVNFLITYGELYGSVRLTYTKRVRNLPDVSPYVGARWQTYGRVTAALSLTKQSSYCILLHLPPVRKSAISTISDPEYTRQLE